MSDRKTLDELRKSRLRAMSALAAAMLSSCTSEELPRRGPYATSGVPNSSGKANPQKRAERKRQRKARRKSR